MQRFVAGAAVATASVAALFPAVAASAPKSPYTASCAVGGVTRADWQHAKLVQVEVDWTAPEGSGVVFLPLIAPVPSPTPPHGFFSTGTPASNGVNPTSATVRFTRTDGVVDSVTATCS